MPLLLGLHNPHEHFLFFILLRILRYTTPENLVGIDGLEPPTFAIVGNALIPLGILFLSLLDYS